MKRLAVALTIVVLAGTAWRAFDPYHIKHPASGQEVTVPGSNGSDALLVSGWKTTPAGRQLPSGDMILSGRVSPDGKLLAFTNTGYTATYVERDASYPAAPRGHTTQVGQGTPTPPPPEPPRDTPPLRLPHPPARPAGIAAAAHTHA